MLMKGLAVQVLESRSIKNRMGQGNGMAADDAFGYEVEESVDEQGWKTVTIKCHGKLVSGDGPELDRLVKPLIQSGGHILIDLADLSYLDSSGLGSLVALKVSAINKGYCKLELVNLSPKVKQLLSMTNLLELFSQSHLNR